MAVIRRAICGTRSRRSGRRFIGHDFGRITPAPQDAILQTRPKRFTLDLSQVTPPVVGYPASVDAMKAALWTKAAPQPHLALFWVAEFLPAGFGGYAFDYTSRGAVMNAAGSKRTAAHEVGHCMGLFHCWDPSSVSAQTKIADTEDKRLMGYGAGVLLRSKEIVRIHQWNPLTVNPLGTP